MSYIVERVEAEFIWACNYADTLFKRGDAIEKRVVTGPDYYRVIILDKQGCEVTLFGYGVANA